MSLFLGRFFSQSLGHLTPKAGTHHPKLWVSSSQFRGHIIPILGTVKPVFLSEINILWKAQRFITLYNYLQQQQQTAIATRLQSCLLSVSIDYCHRKAKHSTKGAA